MRTLLILGILAVSLTTYAQSPVFNSQNQGTLVAAWTMTNGSGTVSSDVCCGNPLTITPGTGGWVTQPGLSKGAYQFDGTTTVMIGANATNINFIYSPYTSTPVPFSFAVWFNNTTTVETVGTYMALVGTLNTSEGLDGYEIGLQKFSSGWYTTFWLIANDGGSVSEFSFNCPITQNALHNFITTYNGNGFTYEGTFGYLDGSLCTFDIVHTNTHGNNQTIAPRLGMREDGSFPFTGNIGPVYIWNRVLTQAEITAMTSNPYAPAY